MFLDVSGTDGESQRVLVQTELGAPNIRSRDSGCVWLLSVVHVWTAMATLVDDDQRWLRRWLRPGSAVTELSSGHGRPNW